MKRNLKREQWMAQFEEALNQMSPQFTGRINWDAAAFLFNQGNSPGLAAVKFVNNETPVERR